MVHYEPTLRSVIRITKSRVDQSEEEPELPASRLVEGGWVCKLSCLEKSKAVWGHDLAEQVPCR